MKKIPVKENYYRLTTAYFFLLCFFLQFLKFSDKKAFCHYAWINWCE